MGEAAEKIEPFVFHVAPVLRLDDEQFFRLCQLNSDLRLEKSADGNLIMMPPAGPSTSLANSELNYQFRAWAKRDETGQVFDSSAGFILPNKATRSPDVSWVSNKRLKRVKGKDWKRFLPLCPEFVLELRSPSDSLPALKAKMEEYIQNGAQLGWLLDPARKHVYVFRPALEVEKFVHPTTISGDPILKGFVLDVPEIWAAMEHPS